MSKETPSRMPLAFLPFPDQCLPQVRQRHILERQMPLVHKSIFALHTETEENSSFTNKYKREQSTATHLTKGQTMQRDPVPHTLTLQLCKKCGIPHRHWCRYWLRSQYGVSEPGSSQTFCLSPTNHDQPYTVLSNTYKCRLEVLRWPSAFLSTT